MMEPHPAMLDGGLRANVELVSHSPVVSALLDAFDGMLLVLDSERHLLAANQQLFVRLGVSNAEACLGRLPGDVLGCARASGGRCGESSACAGCGANRALSTCQRENRTAEGEYLVTVGDGADARAMELHVRATPVQIEGRTFIVLALRDISSEKRRRALEQVFFHDVLNTVSALSGWAQLANQRSPSKATQSVETLSQRLDREIRGQRALLEAEAGTLVLEVEETSPADVLASLRDCCGTHKAARKRTLEFADAPPAALRTDPTILVRVLSNMVLNALEATPPGGTVRVWCEADPGALRFRVHNAGEIPALVAGWIFQRSFTTKQGPGHGLGTWSMKLLGERYLGGRVSFTTSAEAGTVFSFELPCVG